MTTTRVAIGYDKRCWATFEVKDITEDEAAILNDAIEEDPRGIQLLAKLKQEDRLVFLSEDEDDNPDYFADYANPSIISTWDPEEEDEGE